MNLKKLALAEFVILMCGTLFAWGNFTNEFIKWNSHAQTGIACAANVANPFYTPCFFGAIFFTLAFVVSIFILRTVNQKPTNI